MRTYRSVYSGIPPSHGTTAADIHKTTKLWIVENLIHPFLPPMNLPRGESLKPPSPGLWRTSSALSSLPWTSLGEVPSSHPDQDCGEPHPPFPPSHGSPKGRIHQATKPRIAENLIFPFLPPMELLRGKSIKP